MIPQYRIALIAAALCATAGAVSVAAPAHAAPSADTRTSTILLLSVGSANQPEQRLRTAVLRCGGDGGTHASAVQACDDLRAVDGDLYAMAHEDGPCTLEYMPVTATAVGLWQGRPVSYRATFLTGATCCVPAGKYSISERLCDPKP